jgi:hypothetical protein
MIEPERHFSEVEMEVSPRNAPVGVEPMLSITPESLDPIDVIASFRATFLFSDDDVLTTHGEGRISLPFVGVVEASGCRVRNHFSEDIRMVTLADRRNLDGAIALENAKYNDLPGCTPATFAGAVSTEGGLIEFQLALERLTQIFCVGTRCSGEAIEALRGWSTDLDSEPQSIHRNAKDEALKQPGFGSFRQAAEIPDFATLSNDATICAFNSTIGKPPGPVFAAF